MQTIFPHRESVSGSRIPYGCFYKGVAIGATVLIARAYGAGRHQECRKIAEQTMLTELIIVLIFQVVLYFQAPLFLGFFSKDAQILSLARDI